MKAYKDLAQKTFILGKRPIYLFIYLLIYLFVHLFIYLFCCYLFIYLFTYLSMNTNFYLSHSHEESYQFSGKLE